MAQPSASVESNTVSLDPTESALQEIWATVLRIAITAISVEARFTRIGGDSLAAIKVVRLCRKKGITLKVADVLRLQTIRRLAAFLRTQPSPARPAQNVINSIWTISPWRRHHLKLPSDETDYFTRMQSLQDSKEISPHDALTMSRVLDLFKQQLLVDGVESGAVKDVYPCTPLQEGIYFSQKLSTSSYMNYRIWTCTQDAGLVDVTRLENAWKAATLRHSIFSTIFVHHPTTKVPIQVRLASYNKPITHYDSASESPRGVLKSLSTPIFEPGDPQWAVSICKSENGSVACRLDISHAMTDAVSVPIVVKDVISAYGGTQLPASRPFRDVVNALGETALEENVQYWTSFLESAEPCNLPALHPTAKAEDGLVEPTTLYVSTAEIGRQISAFCVDRDITRQVFLQVAWALTLSYCTGKTDVCFGYLASGRDLPIDNVNEIAGPLINMLIARVKLDDALDPTLETVQKISIEQLGHQHVSLAEVQHKLQLGHSSLFNTIMTTYDADHDCSSAGDLQMHEDHRVDRQEYDMALYAIQSGQKTDLKLKYQTSIEHSRAREIASIFESSITYLLSAPSTGKLAEQEDHVGLRAGFFRWRVGVDESTALAYWRSHLVGTTPTQYPPLPASQPVLKSPWSSTERLIRNFQWSTTQISMRTLIYASWSIFAMVHSDSDDVVFGVTLPNDLRDSQSEVVGEYEGEFATWRGMETAPMRVKVKPDQNVKQMLLHLETQINNICTYGRVGLEILRRPYVGGAECCNFQTLLALKPQDDDNQISIPAQEQPGLLESHWSVLLVIGMDGQHLRLQMHYRSSVFSDAKGNKTLEQLEHLLRQFCRPERLELSVQELATASEQDKQTIMLWNGGQLVSNEALVDDLIDQTVQRQLNAQAVHSWDGELTYAELASMSARLAQNLVNHGVIPEQVVPLCFEKSMWTPVAMLAVMKSRGASVALDMTQPEGRLKTIVETVRPSIILSSIRYMSLAATLYPGAKVIAVDYESINRLPGVQSSCGQTKQSAGHPEDLLYLVFTSGSTGRPKGISITHANMCSALAHQAGSFGISTTSRVLDLSSYAFDVAWYNFLHTIYAGATLCIPRSGEDITKAVLTLSPDVVECTPTVAGLFGDEALRCFKSIGLAGEIPDRTLVTKLRDGRLLRNIYGVTECTAFACVSQDFRHLTHIGHGTGAKTWVVNASGRNLAPIGAVGELWLEGPIVGRGYYNDEVRTKQSFIENPPWMLPDDCATSSRRTFRTGDLVRYEEDGTLAYLGRKDSQVKIHGQRLELEEVEHHMRQLLSDANFSGEVAVEAVRLSNGNERGLVAFLVAKGWIKEILDAAGPNLTRIVNEELAQRVPPVMLPISYILISSIPLTVSGKTDRNRLRELGSEYMTARHADVHHREVSHSHSLLTTAETILRRLWARVLAIREDQISAGDSFLSIGGNSLSAMRLIAAAQEQDLELTLADIFRRPRLRDMALRVVAMGGQGYTTSVPPFSMLQVDNPVHFLEKHILPQLQDDCGPIQDVYRLSHIQKLLLIEPTTNALRPPHTWIMDFPGKLDIAKLEATLATLINHVDVLRTLFVEVEGQLFQVVPEKLQIPIVTTNLVATDLESATLKAWEVDYYHNPPQLGQSLLRCVILRNCDVVRLMLKLHHAQWDAIGLTHLVPLFGTLYRGEAVPAVPAFSSYVHQAAYHNRMGAYTYWKSMLRDSTLTSIQPSSQIEECSAPDEPIISKKKTVNVPDAIETGRYTLANIFIAACALMLARITGSRDVVFGRGVSGRHSLPSNCQSLVGACVNVVPARLEVDEGEGLVKLIEKTQNQYLDSIPYEAVGIDQIIANCTEWPDTIRDFWFVAGYRTRNAPSSTTVDGSQVELKFYDWPIQLPQMPAYAVEVNSVAEGSKLHITVNASAEACGLDLTEKMLNGICGAFTDLVRCVLPPEMVSIRTTST